MIYHIITQQIVNAHSVDGVPCSLESHGTEQRRGNTRINPAKEDKSLKIQNKRGRIKHQTPQMFR
jgi:hypothetical protein